jgi:thiamine biosynthesis protein ThiI
VAEHIADREGLAGIVTGESLGQKSSQTAANLAVTAGTVDLPVHRPLLTEPKEQTTERARELGTLEAAQVNAACRTIAPETPATAMDPDRFADLAREVGLDDLVETATERTERVALPDED